MPDPKTLNNNAVYSIVNAARTQALGGGSTAAIANLDVKDIVDAGGSSDVIGSVEAFTKALINVLVKNWFTDTSYRSSYVDPFFEDSAQFGAITQLISVEVPSVKASSNWTSITSGTTTLGQYTIYLPVVNTQYYGKSASFELPIAITGNQWDTAFKSEDELRNFIAYILMCVDNALVVHLEDMSAMNRNNFIAEKYKAATAMTPTPGVHVVDLLGGFVAAHGDSTKDFSVADFLDSQEALIYAAEQISLYSDYIGRMSTMFNTANKARFTPEDRKVLQVLSAFEKRMQFHALSDVYHDELAALPGHQSVAYWQGFGNGGSWSEVSKIIVKPTSYTEGDATTVSNVVAFLADKWAVMHTIVEHRVAAQRFEPEDITQYYYQFTDRYLNDLTQNAIVFVLNAYTAPGT
ncbi:MAG: hypothetical protein J6Y26_02765 [Lachnospiraceae bacterium]|nr:hypothetical protein [Lachnospiraceae bacterium]